MNLLHEETCNFFSSENYTRVSKAGISNLVERQWETSEIYSIKILFLSTFLLRIKYFMSKTKKKKAEQMHFYYYYETHHKNKHT